MKRRTFTQLSGYFFGSLLSSSMLASCNRRSSSYSRANVNFDGALRVWWEEGFYPEEIDALRKIIADWEAESGVTVDLRVIPQKDILLEVNQALSAGSLPDILYSGSADLTIIPKLAWENRLAEVSDVVWPQQDRYSENALAGVSYQNQALGPGARGYYAVPLMQSAIHIHFWEDMLINMVGENRHTIPSDWESFWAFWLAAQPELEDAGAADTYSLGMPMSLSLDTYNNFEQFLEAYDVPILNAAGELRLGEPDVRQRLISALTDYSRFYQAGSVPPDAIDWDNTGNNISLLSRNSLMTVNHTLSAPGSQRSDDEIYYEQLATVKWPDKPSGEPMRFVIEIKQAVLFSSSNNQLAAKSFLTHLSRPENLAAYTEGAQGRYLPAMPELFVQPFWQNPKDTHISVALEQLANTRPAYQVTSPAYGEVAAQNVWGETMRSIALETSSVEQAADQAIASIQRIFTDWQSS